METLKHDKKTSDIFYFSRIIAILAVAVAHTPFHRSDNRMLVCLVDTFACFGVAFFFFSAGYYFKTVGYKQRLFKLCSLALPWGLFGSLGYLVSALSNGFQLGAYLKWMIGWNSYLWFMTIYVLINLIFEGLQYFQKEKLIEGIEIFLLFAMLISRILMPIFNITGAIAFFNIFNWLGFFAVGKFVESKKVIQIFTKKGVLLLGASCLIVLVGCFLIEALLDIQIGYFGYMSVFEQICFIGLVISIASFFNGLPNMAIILGKNTLSIYLLHIVPLQWLCSFFSINIGIYILLAMGIILMLFFGLYAISFLAKKCKVGKVYEKIVGFKV